MANYPGQPVSLPLNILLRLPWSTSFRGHYQTSLHIWGKDNVDKSEIVALDLVGVTAILESHGHSAYRTTPHVFFPKAALTHDMSAGRVLLLASDLVSIKDFTGTENLPMVRTITVLEDNYGGWLSRRPLILLPYSTFLSVALIVFSLLPILVGDSLLCHIPGHSWSFLSVRHHKSTK